MLPPSTYLDPCARSRSGSQDWNGGTIVGVAGKGYCVVAADKRLATGYNIKSRNISRVMKMNERTMIAAGGCHADVQALYNHLKYKATMYRFDHGHDMSTPAAAQLLSNTLYYKRFFPYYALCVCAGLDEKNVGYVAGYDAVGSYLRSQDGYTANGSAAAMVMPILDNLLGTSGVSSGLDKKPELTKEECVEVVKSIFITVGERDIMCGDACDIYVITPQGTEHIEFALKAD